MWRAQMDDLRDTYRVVAVDLPGHGGAGRPAVHRRGRAADEVATRHRGRPPAAERSWSACRSAGTSRWTSRRVGRSSSAAWSCPARRPNRSAASRRRIAPSPGSWSGSTARGSTRSTRGSSGPASRRRSPSRSSPAASGRPAARRPCGPSSGSASRRAWPRIRARPSSSTATGICSSACRRSASRARPAMPAGSACGAPPTSPTSTGRGPSACAIRRFVEGLPDRIEVPASRPVDRREEGPVLDLADPSRVP